MLYLDENGEMRLMGNSTDFPLLVSRVADEAHHSSVGSPRMEDELLSCVKITWNPNYVQVFTEEEWLHFKADLEEQSPELNLSGFQLEYFEAKILF